jgi:hypothetical protein
MGEYILKQLKELVMEYEETIKKASEWKRQYKKIGDYDGMNTCEICMTSYEAVVKQLEAIIKEHENA